MSEIPSSPYDQPPAEALFTPEEPPKSGHGCFFYGCITAIVLAVIGLILLILGIYFGISWLDKTIKSYTSTTPVVLPKVNYTEEDVKDFEARRKAYQDAVDKGEAAELVLSADDINAWIDREPNFKGLAYITIEGDKISGQLSVPLDNFNLPFGLGKGRFFNGSATITVSLRDGELIVHAKEFQLNGQAPAGDFMNQFSRENLAKEWAKQPENAEMLKHLDSIEVKDGKIHVKARAAASARPSRAGPTTPPAQGRARRLPQTQGRARRQAPSPTPRPRARREEARRRSPAEKKAA